MSSDATFSEHISKIADTANQMVGWTLRTFQTRNKSAMLTLWKSLILPKLDYCSQLWNPHQVGDIISRSLSKYRGDSCVQFKGYGTSTIGNS